MRCTLNAGIDTGCRSVPVTSLTLSTRRQIFISCLRDLNVVSKEPSRRKLLKSLGTAGIIGAGGVAGAGATAAGGHSKRKARQMARETVGYLGSKSEFEDWNEQGVKSPELFYAKTTTGSSGSNNRGGSLSYTPSAWVFPIENRGNDVGYIAIGAVRSDSPVLTYGRSKAPQRRLDSAMDVAKASGRSVHKRFLYHSGVQFGVETDDRRMIDLRGDQVRNLRSVESVGEMRFGANKTEDDRPDWSGDTDDEVYGVPNWSTNDLGGEDTTKIGTGEDSWDKWDECTPVATSMAIGYHENIYEWEDNEREALIDRLHKKMNTNDQGITKLWNIDGGIEKYDHGKYSYQANNQHWNEKGNIKDSVGNNNPCVLNMTNGPYSKGSGWVDGHSVTVVGYRTMSCGPFCSYTHHKVHNGYDSPPDRVAHGNWSDAMVTRIKPK